MKQNLSDLPAGKIAQKLAYKLYKTTGCELEELLSEASLAYIEALKSYNPEKSALTTWVWSYVYNSLLQFINKQHNIYNYELMDSNDEIENHPSPPNQNCIIDFLEDLSIDSKGVCKIIFNTPIEILSEYLFTTPKHARRKLRDELRKEGWTWVRIWNAFREIKFYLNKYSKNNII